MTGAAGRSTLSAATWARSRTSALVDLGLDVQDVAQLVDPVVQVHGPQPRPVGRRAASPGPTQRSQSSRRSAQVSTSRCLGALGGHLGRSSAASSRCRGRPCWRLGPGGRRRARRRRAPARAGGARRGRRGTAPSRPRPRRRSRAKVARGDVGHVARRARDHASASGSSSASRPVSRPAAGPPCARVLAGERHRPRGRHLGRRRRPPRPRRPPRRARGRAGCGRRTRARPCPPRRAARARAARRAPPPRTRRRERSMAGQSGGTAAPAVARWGREQRRLALVQEASGAGPGREPRPAGRRWPPTTPTWSCCRRRSRATSARPAPTSSAYAEPLDGPFATELARVAAERGTTVVAGMFETGPTRARPSTRCVVRGAAAAAYRKIHLYDSFGYRESDRLAPGDAGAGRRRGRRAWSSA